MPTLSEFAPRFIEGYAEANRQKPSGIDAKERILRLYLKPVLGSKRLDAIKSEDVQRLKARLSRLPAKKVSVFSLAAYLALAQHVPVIQITRIVFPLAPL